MIRDDAPLVSLGVPVYNGENYLAEALDSLLAQTFTDFEIVITDNASTDGTEAIGRAYASRDPRVRYVRNETNLGAAGNFNRAFARSRGKYFKWAAHDDIIAPEFLERCVEVLELDPGVVLAYPRVSFIDEHGEVLARFEQRMNLQQAESPARLAHFLRYRGRELDENGQPLLKKRTPWPQFSPVFGLIRADVLRQTRLIGDFISSDRVLLAELALRGRFYEVPEYLLFIRYHPAMRSKYRTTGRYSAWFSPRNRGKRVLRTFKLVNEYRRAIARTPLTPGERMRCLLTVGQYALLRDGTKNLLKFLRKRVWGSIKQMLRALGLRRPEWARPA